MLLRSKRKLPEFDSDRDGRHSRRRRQKLEPSSSKSLPNTYKSRVLKALNNKDDQSNRLTCELRMVFFVAAAKDPRRVTLLQPFPPSFINAKYQRKEFAEVTQAINTIPRLESIKDSTDLPELSWELLDWVFNHNTTTTLLEPLTKDIPVKIKKLRLMTGLANLPVPNNSNVFMFKITQTQPKQEFNEAKEKYGSTFAFHGSRTHHFHSILHRGLMRSFNVQSAYGHGTYMSPDIETSKLYSSTNRCWPQSSFGNTFACVVIVEVVMSPDTQEFSDDDVYIRL